MADFSDSNTKLVPIPNIKSFLRHPARRNDRFNFPFVASVVSKRLLKASEYLKQYKDDQGRKYELLIWDAHRDQRTHASIFSSCVANLKSTSQISMTSEEVIESIGVIIGKPDTVFSYGTGGGLDVTLLIDNNVADMGTDFYDFVPESNPDWYRLYTPKSKQSTLFSRNRELLRSAMEYAEFVISDKVWWHFEWGTKTWALSTGNEVVLDTILVSPIVENSACYGRVAPFRQPALETGVAQVFMTPYERAESLAHRRPGHYYARNSHPTVEALGNFYRHSIVKADYIYLTGSGLSACVTCIKSIVPIGGRVVYDTYIYYEVERELIFMAAQYNWELIKVDLTDPEAVDRRLRGYPKIELFFYDTPRNWWLDSLDVVTIYKIARRKQAIIVADISVQPLQPLLEEQCADVIICSLSKYPSLGLTMGGVVLSNNEDLINNCQAVASREGHVLSPDSAVTIWSQVVSLRDRLMSLSSKAEEVVIFLRNHKSVWKVRIPNRDLSGGLVGGQISFHLRDHNHGTLMEEIIGQNALSQKTSLHLACTFGASITTFEHFASNIRHRTGIPREATNEVSIPDDIVRLGIGCECAEDIINDLEFLLNIVAV